MNLRQWSKYFPDLEAARVAMTPIRTLDEIPPSYRGIPADIIPPIVQEAVRNFCDDPETLAGHRWLVLIGPAGCGKTIGAATAAEILEGRGFDVAWLSATDVGYAYEMRDAALKSRLDLAAGAPFLVVDDLTRLPMTSQAFRLLDAVLDQRFTHRLPTIVTANLPEGDQDPGQALSQMVGGPLTRRLLERPYTVILA